MGLFDLSGKVALVTGGSGDFGAAICRTLAEHGADVAVHFNANAETAEAVAESVRAAGRNAVTVKADIRDRQSVIDMVDAVARSLGSPDIVVNNAGTRRRSGDHKYVLDITEEEWDREIESHLKGAFLCCQAALPAMIARNWGRLINIASVVGRSGASGASIHYPSAKAGMVGMTKAIANQVAGHLITCNAIAPGIIDTERVRWRTPEQMKSHVSQIPLGRLGKVDEIAAGVLYLASPAGAYVTGATLDINGGLYMA